MDFIAGLRSSLQQRSPDYSHALVSLVSRIGEGENEFLRGRVEFLRAPTLGSDTSTKIGPLLLERGFRPGKETVEVLEGLLNHLASGIKQTGQPWNGEFTGFQARPKISNVDEPGWLAHSRVGLPNAIGEPRFCAWPSIQAWASPPNANNGIDLAGPIVDSDAGIVSDPFQLMDEFLGASLKGWPGTHRGLWFLLPDFRGRFSRVELDGGSIKADFELGTLPLSDVKFMLNIDGRPSSGPLSPTEDRTVVVAQLPRTATSVQLVIMDERRKEPIDWVNLVSDPWYVAPEVRYTYSPEQVSWLVSRGESESLEFKEYPTEKSSKKKHHEDLRRIIETVVAFSNTNGGVILVCVTDDGRGSGVDVDAARHSIIQSVRDQTEPLIQLEFEKSELEGMPVLLVKVPRGQDRPYTSRLSGAVHVRAGASNFRARSEEIRLLAGGPR